MVRARRRFRAAYGAGLDWIDGEEGGSGREGAPQLPFRPLYCSVSACNRSVHFWKYCWRAGLCLRRVHDGLERMAPNRDSALAAFHVLLHPSGVSKTFCSQRRSDGRCVRHAPSCRSSGTCRPCGIGCGKLRDLGGCMDAFARLQATAALSSRRRTPRSGRDRADCARACPDEADRRVEAPEASPGRIRSR